MARTLIAAIIQKAIVGAAQECQEQMNAKSSDQAFARGDKRRVQSTNDLRELGGDGLQVGTLRAKNAAKTTDCLG